MMKPLALFLILLLCSAVYSKSSKRANKLSRPRSDILQKPPVVGGDGQTTSVVKLLRARKTFFQGAFVLSHIVALIKCVSTIDILLKDPSSAFDTAVSSAIGSSIGHQSLLPPAYLQSLYSFFQVILSFSCHIGYSCILNQHPSAKQFMSYLETDDLRLATAVLVLKEESGWGNTFSVSRRVIVPLGSSEMKSVNQCLSRLHLTTSTATKYDDMIDTSRSEMSSGEGRTRNVEARKVEVDDLKLFLFQSTEQKPKVRLSKKVKAIVRVKKSKSKKKKPLKEGLTVVAAVPDCNINLKELKEMISRMGKFDELVRGKANMRTEATNGDTAKFGLTAAIAIERLKLYGRNSLSVRQPTILERITGRFLSSTYIMKTFFQFLSILEEPIQTPVGRIGMSVLMDTWDIIRDTIAAKKLENAVTSATTQRRDSSFTPSSSSSFLSSVHECIVIRDSKEVQITIEDLVPGDILCIGEGPVPADCLLLEGSCVVNEAFLTGEAVPQPRESIDCTYSADHLESSKAEGSDCEDNDQEGGRLVEVKDAVLGGDSRYFSLLKYQKSILHGGSELLQYTCSNSLYGRHPLRCLVLKTGFSSVQGILLRKMKALEDNQNVPSAGSGLLSPALHRDLSKLLACLSCSAVGFSLYVYEQGRLKGISRYRLLVQICRIVATLASPDIEKDITYTIRKSARRLTRTEEVHCTDPSKVAVAGLVTACLFDKTGTIATDIVVAGDAVTLCPGAPSAERDNETHNALASYVDSLFSSSSPSGNLDEDIDNIKAEWHKQEWSLSASPLGLQIVVATCHSAMELQPKDGSSTNFPLSKIPRYIGDPLECALLDQLGCPPNPRSTTVSKTKSTVKSDAGAGVRTVCGEIQGAWKIDANSKSAVWVAQALDPGPTSMDLMPQNVTVSTVFSYPFEVQLQRMSVVASLCCPRACRTASDVPHSGRSGGFRLGLGLEGGEGGGVVGVRKGRVSSIFVEDDEHQQHELLITTKGSPESIFTCLSARQRQDKTFRAQYFTEFERLARQGKRVIAFASKKIPRHSPVSSISREDAEENLLFQGFISFSCPIRLDSRAAIITLTNAKLKVGMLTGDSLLTALHTARECSIVEGRYSADEDSSVSSSSSSSSSSSRSSSSSSSSSSGSSSSSSSSRSSRSGDCSSDVRQSKILVLSVSNKEGDKDGISVTPSVQKRHTPPALMCLVWKNEEGMELFKYCSDARKIYSRMKRTNLNTYDSISDSELVDDNSDLVGMSARELSLIGGFELVTSGDAIALLCKGGPGSPKGDTDELCFFKVFARADPETKSSVVNAFKSAGEVVLMCGDGANDVLALKSADVGVALLTGFNLLNADRNGSNAPLSDSTSSAREIKTQDHYRAVNIDDDGESDIKIGDASAAAPFTARRPSISSVVSLIRHGRAAHALVLQSFQVACIEALIRGIGLSFLFLNSIRYTPEQSLVLEIIGITVNFGILQVPPVESLSQRTPPHSALSPNMLRRLIIQILHHVGSTLLGLKVGLAIDARHVASAPPLAYPAPPSAGDPLWYGADSRSRVHEPHGRDTVMFLLSIMQIASIPLGTYMGRPFLPDTQEMPKLRHFIVLVIATTAMTALQLIPGVNGALKLFPLTGVIDKLKVLFVVGLSLVIVVFGLTAVDI